MYCVQDLSRKSTGNVKLTFPVHFLYSIQVRKFSIFAVLYSYTYINYVNINLPLATLAL